MTSSCRRRKACRSWCWRRFSRPCVTSRPSAPRLDGHKSCREARAETARKTPKIGYPIPLCTARQGSQGLALGGRCLVLEPGQAFLPSQNDQDVEDTWGGCPAGQGRPERLGDRAELGADPLGVAADRLLGGLGGPGPDGFEHTGKIAKQRQSLRGEQRLGLVVECERTLRPDEACRLEEIDQRLGALLQFRHGH